MKSSTCSVPLFGIPKNQEPKLYYNKKGGRRYHAASCYYALPGFFIGEGGVVVEPLYKTELGDGTDCIPQPQWEWVPSMSFTSMAKSTIMHVRGLNTVWKKLQHILSPGKSPLAMFWGHPRFCEAVQHSKLQAWVDHDMIEFWKFGAGWEMYPQSQTAQVMGTLPIFNMSRYRPWSI